MARTMLETPAPGRRVQETLEGAVEKGAYTETLTPSEPVRAEEGSNCASGGRATGGNRSSLIFGGGGDFLAKYTDSVPAAKGENSKPRHRKKGETAAVNNAVAAPDRLNIQLNTLLVRSRSVAKILEVVAENLEAFNDVNLITALHRVASVHTPSMKPKLRRDPCIKMLVSRLQETLRNAVPGALKPQDLSNIAWALTKLGMLHAGLVAQLNTHILSTISSFQPVNLSMTLWAFARAGVLDEILVREAAVEVKRKLPEFQPQQLANTTWAMAKSGFIDKELFLSAAELALRKRAEFLPMNISMLLYSFALARVPHPQLFKAVAKHCTYEAFSLGSSTPHAITNLAFAYSEANELDAGVFGVVARVATDSMSEFRVDQLIILANAFARAQIRDKKLFERIGRKLASLQVSDKEIQDLKTSYESLGFSTTELLSRRELQLRTSSGLRLRMFLAVLMAVLLALILTRLSQESIASGASN